MEGNKQKRKGKNTRPLASARKISQMHPEQKNAGARQTISGSHSNHPKACPLAQTNPPGFSSGKKIGENGAKAPALFSNFGYKFLLFSAAFLVLGILAAGFVLNPSPAPPSWVFGDEAPQLAKTANLSFDAGQTYEYAINMQGRFATVSLLARYKPNCPGFILEDEKNSYSICIRKSGFYSNYSGYIGDQSFPFYSPWMLYLTQNLSWKENQTVTFYPANLTQKATLLFEAKNLTKIFGRDAYEVKVSSSSSSPFFANTPNATYFVDAQKRVLLKAQIGSSQIILISAPFALENNSG
ncbi:MAG: hypothetical protein V1822_03360 [Candidatus Micrarchaeota archaeon]